VPWGWAACISGAPLAPVVQELCAYEVTGGAEVEAARSGDAGVGGGRCLGKLHPPGTNED
jgi:hypothetical protein